MSRYHVIARAEPRTEAGRAMVRLGVRLGWLTPGIVTGILAIEDETACDLSEVERLRAALGNLLSYPGPVRMTPEAHQGCQPDECYVTAARSALDARVVP